MMHYYDYRKGRVGDIDIVVIALHDELLNTTYAPPAELPVKTEKVPII
jgi:hypothetical protein